MGRGVQCEWNSILVCTEMTGNFERRMRVARAETGFVHWCSSGGEANFSHLYDRRECKLKQGAQGVRGRIG